MIREWILDQLQTILLKKKHEVIRLQWEKAALERKLEQAAAAGSQRSNK